MTPGNFSAEKTEAVRPPPFCGILLACNPKLWRQRRRGDSGKAIRLPMYSTVIVVNGAVVPVPEEPEGPERVTVEQEDMEEALPPRRGRPRRAYDRERLAEVMRLYFLEKMSMRQVADVLGVSHMSVYRMLSDPAVELLI